MASRVSFAVAFAGFFVTVLLGNLGWREAGFGPAEAFYRTLLAFGGDGIYAPRIDHPPLNAFLLVSRLTGLVTTIAALIGLTAVFAGTWLVRLRAKLQRGHVVVIGGDAFAIAQAQSVGYGAVTCLSQSPPEQTSLRHLFVEAKNNNAAVIIAHLGQPRKVIFATQKSEENITLARAVLSARPELKKKLILRLESTAVIRELELYAHDLKFAEVVSSSEQIAGAFSDAIPLTHLSLLRGQKVPHVLFFGMGRIASSVLKEMVMRTHHPTLDPLMVDVVDCEKANAYARLASDSPRLLEMLEEQERISFHEFDGLCCTQEEQSIALELLEQKSPLTCIVVATGDDSRNIGIAMRLREIQTTRLTLRAPILIRNEIKMGYTPEKLSSLSDGIARFGGTPHALEARRKRRAQTAMAARIHEGWLSVAAQEGRSMPHWDDLSALQRYSNERAVASAPEVLRAVGYQPDAGSELVPLRISRSAARLGTQAEFDQSVQACEHARWSIERAIAGYSLAEDGERDDEMRKHPNLTAFSKLDKTARGKDDRVIQELIAAASAVGSRPFVHTTAQYWRRRLRLSVFGPIKPNAMLCARLHDVADMLMRSLPLEADAYALQILTPNAPGFDRLAPITLVHRWERAAKRSASLLKMQIMSSDGLHRKAAVMQPREAVSEEKKAQWADMLGQLADLDRQFDQIDNVDLRPLGCSDAMLLRDPSRCDPLIDRQNALMVSLSDVCVFGLNSPDVGGEFTRKTIALAENRGVPSLIVTPDATTLAGDWKQLAQLPKPDQRGY